MGFSRHVRYKFPIGILLIFKDLPLNCFFFCWFVFRFAHNNKTVCPFPSHRLVDTLVIFNLVSLPNLIPFQGIKRWIAALVAKDILIPFSSSAASTLSQLMNSPSPRRITSFTHPGKIFLKARINSPTSLSPHRLSYPQLPGNILPRLLYKTQHGTEPLLPSILRIMPFATSLLLTIDRFYGRVYINMDTPILFRIHATPLPQCTHYFHNDFPWFIPNEST